MNEVGAEAKPDWADVPVSLREKIRELLGAPVTDAKTVHGGFGPSATFMVRTANGRSAFCKGAHPGQTDAGKEALLRERANYLSFPELAAFAPRYFGSADANEWHVLLLESIDRAKEVPPWDKTSFQSAIDLLARFHASTPERASTVLAETEPEPGWGSLTRDEAARERFLALFEESAGRWFDKSVGQLAELEKGGASLAGPRSWIHLDVRSDNLLFGNTRPCLVDWPGLAFGPTLIDIAFFLPSVAGEGGPSPSDGLKAYQSSAGKSFRDDDISIAAAMISGFFAARAGEPDPPLLPRLRWIQRLQLFPALAWACELLKITPPARRL